MDNPWEKIHLDIYEKHMQSEHVFQLQTLNRITKAQIHAYDHRSIRNLGVAGGNGLEHINLAQVDTIYGFDINQTYLDRCAERFFYMRDKLNLIQKDFTEKSFTLPTIDLLIANMIIEYVGIRQFTEFLSENNSSISVLSCTIQSEEKSNFVSKSDYTSAFDSLETVLHSIHPAQLVQSLRKIGFECIEQKDYQLPNEKRFIRLDFKR